MDKRSTVVELIPSEQIPEEICLFFKRAPGEICRMKGRLYLLIERDVLCCEDTLEGNRVIYAVQKKIRNDSFGVNHKDIWYQIITEQDSDRIITLAKAHGLEYKKKRTVILFRVKYPQEQPLDRIFSEMAPLEDDDRLVMVNHDMLALIRVSSDLSEDEIAEYAAAVIDTMASEGVTDLQAGIGTEAEELGRLHVSFTEAMSALETGTCFHPNETLFCYSAQKLERIIETIPEANRERIIRDFFSGSIRESLNEEMMETVRVFFRNDLNITAASRELFIHRNTLNYRLDKIKRDTGLDLRTFQDAVVFKVICGMKDKSRYTTA